MVIARKGRMSKWDKIQNAIKTANDIREVYEILDCSQFNLTNEETCRIAQNWQREQEILMIHRKGVYAPSPVEA